MKDTPRRLARARSEEAESFVNAVERQMSAAMDEIAGREWTVLRNLDGISRLARGESPRTTCSACRSVAGDWWPSGWKVEVSSNGLQFQCRDCVELQSPGTTIKTYTGVRAAFEPGQDIQVTDDRGHTVMARVLAYDDATWRLVVEEQPTEAQRRADELYRAITGRRT